MIYKVGNSIYVDKSLWLVVESLGIPLGVAISSDDHEITMKFPSETGACDFLSNLGGYSL